jgi:hypothetical protein
MTIQTSDGLLSAQIFRGPEQRRPSLAIIQDNPMAITTENETTTSKGDNVVTLVDNYQTVERAIRERLPDFDVSSDKHHPVVAGWMRRALRKNLARLAELKKMLEGQP